MNSLVQSPIVKDDRRLPGARPINRHPGLADEAYNAIFAQLMGLSIEPGSRITVDNLARELNVSQTPIREALRRLEGEGLVGKTHLVGYRATPQISRRRFDELYDLRLLLEPEATLRTARAMDERRLTVLKEKAGLMSSRGSGDNRLNYSAFARQDALFHDKILEFAGNELIRRTLAQQHAHFHIFRLMFHPQVTAEALDEHEAVLAAFAAADGQAAKRAMRQHIERSRDRLLPAFK